MSTEHPPVEESYFVFLCVGFFVIFLGGLLVCWLNGLLR